MTGQPLAVSDVASNPDDQIRFYAQRIGNGNMRRLFAAVYHGKKRVKEVDDLARGLGVSRKDVLWLGKQLADMGAVRLVKKNGAEVLGYERVLGLITLKKPILRARNRAKIEKLPSKARPVVSGSISLRHSVVNPGRARRIYLEGIDCFSKVRRIRKVPDELDPPRLPELEFKHGVRFVIDDKSSAKDWGGEHNDLVTTHLTVKRKRLNAAFAFKGPGKSGTLTPAKMGTNGDQIQRMVESPSAPDVVFVQYEGEIAESVVQQLRTFSSQRAATEGRTILYGTIDLRDSYKLRLAYPDAFAKAKRLYGRKRAPTAVSVRRNPRPRGRPR